MGSSGSQPRPKDSTTITAGSVLWNTTSNTRAGTTWDIHQKTWLSSRGMTTASRGSFLKEWTPFSNIMNFGAPGGIHLHSTADHLRRAKRDRFIRLSCAWKCLELGNTPPGIWMSRAAFEVWEKLQRGCLQRCTWNLCTTGRCLT